MGVVEKLIASQRELLEAVKVQQRIIDSLVTRVAAVESAVTLKEEG